MKKIILLILFAVLLAALPLRSQIAPGALHRLIGNPSSSTPSVPPVLTNSVVVDDGSYNAFPGLVRFPDGKLLVAYRTGTNHVGSIGTLNYRTSTDNGSTWSAASLLYTNSASGYDARGCEVALLTNNTCMVVGYDYEPSTHTEKGAFCFIGTNGTSISWSSKITLVSTNYFGASSRPIQLADGNVLAFVYGKHIDGQYRPATVQSTDQGATWGIFNWLPGITAKEVTETVGRLLSGGIIMVLARMENAGGAGSYYWTQSIDATNWTAFDPALTGITDSKPEWLQYGASTNYCVMFSRGFHSNTNGWYWRSTDQGKSWGAALAANPTGYEDNYSSTVLYGTNRLLVANARGPLTNMSMSSIYFSVFDLPDYTNPPPVLAWRLDETTGTRYSVYGTGFDLVDSGINYSTGILTNAAVGLTNQNLSLSNCIPVQNNGQVIAMTCWAMLTNKAIISVPTIMCKGTVANYGPFDYMLAYNQGEDRFKFLLSAYTAVGSAVAANNLGSVATNTWYFLYACYDRTNLSISVNAGTPDTQAYSVPGTNSSALFYLVNDSLKVRQWTGKVDEFALYKRPLTMLELTNLYNGGSPVPFQ